MRTLIYDIETSYIIGATWGIYQQDVMKVIQDWQILMFAYKWLGEKKTHIVSQDDFKDYKKGKLNDYNVVKRLHELFSEADIVVAHNGNSFDQKKAQARMMIHKMTPPEPYMQIDTKLEVKRVAAHTSNKLSDLAQSLELTHKLDAGGLSTWTGCMEGDPKAWKRMKTYNRGDVITLEELYLEIRPWMKNHPNFNVLENTLDRCTKCGSPDMVARGFYVTKTGKRQRYLCKDCGAWSQDRYAEPQIQKVRLT